MERTPPWHQNGDIKYKGKLINRFKHKSVDANLVVDDGDTHSLSFTPVLGCALRHAKLIIPFLLMNTYFFKYLFVIACTVSASGADFATGIVYHDANRNQKRDTGEQGIPNVAVSNGMDITETDAQGRWKLPSSDDVIFFVLKPSGWMTPLNDHLLPRFHYIHKPNGSPPSSTPTQKSAPTPRPPSSSRSASIHTRKTRSHSSGWRATTSPSSAAASPISACRHSS